MTAPQPHKRLKNTTKADMPTLGMDQQACSTSMQQVDAAGVEQLQQSVAPPACHRCQQHINSSSTSSKPRLRGVLHGYACAAMLSAGAMLVAEAQTPAARWCALVYVSAATLQFFISAVYHMGHWQPGTHKLLMRLDHSCIFFLIAATYTPIVAIALGHDPLMSRRLLVRVWVSALCGAAKTCLWPSSPRLLSALTYVAVGWSAVPYMPLLTQSVDMHVTVLIALGGVLYTIGAIVYATRYPDPYPLVLGFHEVFHGFVVAASICHFAACYHVVVKVGAKTVLSAAGLDGGALAAAAAPAGAGVTGEEPLCWQRLVVAGA